MKQNRMKNNPPAEIILRFPRAAACRVGLFIFCWAFPFSLFGQNDSAAQSVRFDPARFRENSRILIGKLPIRVMPRREYAIKAGSSGLIELYVPPKSGNFKAGDRLGGIDVERIVLDKELMELSESLLKEKEIPQWHLQRKTQIDQLKTQLSTIEGERELAERMLADPGKYKDLFKGMKGSKETDGKSMQTYLSGLKDHQAKIMEILSFIQSDRKEELELGELFKKFESKKMQFDLREKEAYLTIPFDGHVQFLFPYVAGEKNYVSLGTELALVRDLSEVYGHVPIVDSRWRLLGKSKIELEVAVSTGVARAKYAKSLKKEISGSEQLIYTFLFDPSDNQVLMNQMSGTVEGKLFQDLGRKARLVPKFLLVSLNPETFREAGWKGLVENLVPGYELLQVGLQSIALAKTEAP
jgi:hypothetical protein